MTQRRCCHLVVRLPWSQSRLVLSSTSPMTFSTGLLRGFGNNSYADLLFVETLPSPCFCQVLLTSASMSPRLPPARGLEIVSDPFGEFRALGAGHRLGRSLLLQDELHQRFSF